LSSGDLVFGTILNGLYLTDPAGRLKYHINQENGLQNNTVLSLFEDRAHELWVGLDKGIDLVVLDSPLQYFQDKTGVIGAVYAASIFDGHMYLGTNQGIFTKNYPGNKNQGFQLLPGSQGQVWDLQVFDGQLIAGLNNGSALIDGPEMDYLFSSTGVYTTIRHPFLPDVLFQGSYTGINVLRKGAKGKWIFSNTIEGADFSAYKLAFNSTGQLWVLHPKKGLYRISLDTTFKKAEKIERLGTERGLPSEFNLDLAVIGADLIVKSDSLFFSWDEKTGHFKQRKSLGNTSLQPGNFQIVGGRQGEWFQVFPNYTSFHNGRASKLRISLITGNERILPLEGLGYLFCLDDGYAIMPFQLKETLSKKALPPFITMIEIGQNQVLDEPSVLSQPIRLKPSTKQIRFFYTSPIFTFRPSMRTRLLGFDEKWSAFLPIYGKEFTNLSPGEYEFQVQGEESEATTSFRFVIEPHWYQSYWAIGGYALLVSALAWLLLQWHSRRMRLQMLQLQKEKEKELEQQRVKANNEMLQAEVLNKNRKLADSTMELIRKNEMLQSIKNNLTKLESSKDTERQSKAIRQLNHMIDSHLSSEEDWKVFESNFNQLHDQFFKRLKDQFPDLTPGDLRLAAYLKMNLSSKEIAPLLNISLRGVENKRYRLRKKLNIDADDNLTEMLMKF
jgi:DNA-binding CsgD family transcriptional regulator